jgi:trehalose 6-phosphate phosphatase
LSLFQGKERAVAAGEKVDRQHFMAQLAEARRAVLLLDYDGTLAPFRDDRHSARPYPGVVALLRRIMATGRTRVVIVTGRSASDTVRLLGLDPHPEIWGSHGLQRCLPSEDCAGFSFDEQETRGLLDAVVWLEHVGLRDLAEVKPGAVAVHWRGLPGPTVREIRHKVLEGWWPLAHRTQMVLAEFDSGYELRLPGGKADAVHTVLAEEEPGAPVAYLGDDRADEEAFHALPPHGLAVLVRAEWRETRAGLWLKPPEELLDFLEQWSEARGGSR